MPELPEVEGLALDLTGRLTDRAIVRVDIAAFSALKTFDPPLSALNGLMVDDVTRHGKFLDITASGLHLVVHLSRAGWVRWRDEVPKLPPKPSHKAWRLYEFSKEQPQYFALVFLDRRVPRIGREYERFAFMSELKSRLRAQMQRCIEEGIFPASVDADVGLRLIWASILGIAALRLSERLPAEDADDLILDAIDTTIAGLRAGAPSRARPSTPFGSSSHSDVAHTS